MLTVATLAVDLDPLPVSRARLTVVEPALFEWDVFGNGNADPKSRQERGAFRHTISQRKSERPAEIHKQILAVLWRYELAKCDKVVPWKVRKIIDDDDGLQEIMTWFKGQVADFYDSGIQKLVPRINKCLDNVGVCFEK